MPAAGLNEFAGDQEMNLKWQLYLTASELGGYRSGIVSLYASEPERASNPINKRI